MSIDGTWQRLLVAVPTDADADGELDWLVAAVDSTVVRAHQHAARVRLGKDDSNAVASPPITASAVHVAG